MYAKEINRPFPPQIIRYDNEIEGLDEEIKNVFENICKKNDIDEALCYVQSEKTKHSKNRERRSDRYAVLSIIEKV